MVDPPVLFDTCILIDYLQGVTRARAECARYSDRSISIITWMEVLAGATETNQAETREFLRNFRTVSLTPRIAELAVAIRSARRIKLPDAIIQATAESEGRVLVTRNTRDFPAKLPGIRIPYSI